jgi:hypothetical protein
MAFSFADFNPMAFVDNLYYMGMGMAGIIIVMGVLIAITTLLNKIFSKSRKKDKEDK